MAKIGIDLEQNTRFIRLVTKESFMNGVYTPKEIEYINKKGFRAAAGIFCVKEAFSKALGCGIIALEKQNVQVIHGEKGRPMLELFGKYKDLKCDISISHSGEHSTAVCIIEEIEELK